MTCFSREHKKYACIVRKCTFEADTQKELREHYRKEHPVYYEFYGYEIPYG